MKTDERHRFQPDILKVLLGRSNQMKHAFTRNLFCIGGWLAFLLQLVSCAPAELRSAPVPHQSGEAGSLAGMMPGHAGNSLRVMTLNMAHGRGTVFHQALLSTDRTRKNLEATNTLLDRVEPHVTAFQEADAPSFWSGRFNHMEYLASLGAPAHVVLGSHVDAIGLSYGTALLSRLELSNPESMTFAPSLTTIPTGFVVATIRWPQREDFNVDVVSLHLDFMSASMRKKQLDELIALLRIRSNPVIVMGDFNAGWQDGSAPQYLADQLGLSGFRPEDSQMITFPKLRRRLDWILISPDFAFSDHEVIEDRVSDHLGVTATLVLADNRER